MIAVLFIALSLSMDAFAVSVSSGVGIRNLRFFHALRASFFFGLFQFLMPMTGWYLGSAFVSHIEAFDHWVVFGLLAFIGGKMLFEAIRQGKDSGPEAERRNAADIRNIKTLLLLSVATSIDALAAGIGLGILGHGVWLSAALIGGITFAVCLCGFEFGRRIGAMLEKWAQIAGGLVLIAIGVKILIQHLWS